MYLPQLQKPEVTLSMKLMKKNLLIRNFPRLLPMRDKILWQKIPRVRRESTVHNQEETTMCSIIIRKIPIVKSVRGKNTSQVQNKTKEARGRDCTDYKFGRQSHGSSKISECGMRVEMRTRKRKNRARWFHIGFIVFPMKTKHRKQCRVYNDYFRHRCRK